MNIWHLSREFRFFFSPYHSWVPLQLGLPQICPVVGWDSHRWQQPEHYQTQHTAWVGQPATAARSHSLMHWNPVAWQHMHIHAQRSILAGSKGQKGLSGIYENALMDGALLGFVLTTFNSDTVSICEKAWSFYETGSHETVKLGELNLHETQNPSLIFITVRRKPASYISHGTTRWQKHSISSSCTNYIYQ